MASRTHPRHWIPLETPRPSGFRSRIVGGRTNHWGRIALRFSPIDFKSYTRDGLGTDWPIGYEDIAPYYDKVESYIGVFGTKENVSSAPAMVFS